jgi:hypothetical protein
VGLELPLPAEEVTMGVWDHPEMAQEWAVEALSAWAAHVVEGVERARGNATAAYSSLHELADELSMWDDHFSRMPGQVWFQGDLQAARRRVAHLLDGMCGARHLISGQPAWLTLQLEDLLAPGPGLPRLSVRETERRIRYLRLHGTVERLVRSRFDIEIAAVQEADPWDPRRPETADEGVHGLMDPENVRPRTLDELADDLHEDAGRSHVPQSAVEFFTRAATLLRSGDLAAVPAVLEQLEECLLAEIDGLGDFRTPLRD